MKRKYPFDIIDESNRITKKQATSLVLKFLMQHNCTKEYYVCWKHSQKKSGRYNGKNITIEEIIEYGVNWLQKYGYGLNSLFICIAASFDWLDAQSNLGFDSHYWLGISDEWKLQLDAEILFKE